MTQAQKLIGFWTATALVVGNTIGAGIFFLPVSLAPYGAISLVGWIATSAGALLVATMFSRLARRSPDAGGPYAYTRNLFGDFLAFEVAWAYWACCWMSNAAIAVGATSYLSFLWPELHTNQVLSACVALSFVWLATLVNIRGVRHTAIAQLIITVIKVIPLIAIGIGGLFLLNPAHFVPLNQSGTSNFSAINATALLTLWAFLGIESATIPAQHAINPKRTIPLATMAGTIFCALIYLISTTSILGLLSPAALAASSAPLADGAALLFGPWGSTLVALGAVISGAGALVGWILLQGQMPYAAAIDGLFPKKFAQLSTHGVPLFGLIFSSMLITAMMLMNYSGKLTDQFTYIVTLSTFIVLVSYTASALADIVALFREKSSWWKKTTAMAASSGALAFSIWAMFGAGEQAMKLGLLFLALGVPVYYWQRRKKNCLQLTLS